MWTLIQQTYPYLIKALLITIVVELAALFVMKERRVKVYILVLVVNIVTNLTMNIVIHYMSFEYYVALVILEIAVVGVEAVFYYCIYKNVGKALLFSALCNVASLVVGLVV